MGDGSAGLWPGSIQYNITGAIVKPNEKKHQIELNIRIVSKKKKLIFVFRDQATYKTWLSALYTAARWSVDVYYDMGGLIMDGMYAKVRMGYTDSISGQGGN